MEFLHTFFHEYSRIYQKSITKIRKIETETGIGAINFQFTNNLRHSVEHLTAAISQASSEPTEQARAIKQMQQAIFHIDHLAIDAFEHIAGVQLRKLTDRILSAGFFSEHGEAENLREDAVRQYKEARNKRSIEPEQAMTHFIKVVEISGKGLASIKPITRLGRANLVFGLGAALSGIVALILLLDKFFKFLPGS